MPPSIALRTPYDFVVFCEVFTKSNAIYINESIALFFDKDTLFARVCIHGNKVVFTKSSFHIFVKHGSAVTGPMSFTQREWILYRAVIRGVLGFTIGAEDVWFYNVYFISRFVIAKGV